MERGQMTVATKREVETTAATAHPRLIHHPPLEQSARMSASSHDLIESGTQEGREGATTVQAMRLDVPMLNVATGAICSRCSSQHVKAMHLDGQLLNLAADGTRIENEQSC
eukprot:scaffold164988_cov19-Tisochrysis_lutea.AAC.4